MEKGRKLLKLFRKEQLKRDNVGCMCGDCTEDMDNALNNYIQGKCK
ncbi:hypothetical protein LCGC14_0694180 [marine sediment metagenome]|uniref:Uncharacterized protein n=1 Tax=marine sediment metagenome TaxID=412755 RepID=A0A0F9T5V5_9ZZZZ